MEKNSQFDRTESTSALTCSEFDALLTDALDGVLSAASQRRFESHRERCPTCGPLFRETVEGVNWLNSLEEVEAPANLVHNILAATSMQASAATAAAAKLTWKQRLSEVFTDVAAPVRAIIRQPRIAMTAAMAMFSLSLTLNLVGVRLSDLRHIDLRPSAIRTSATLKYTETSNRVIQYYYSIRLVYEVESRLQELKRATTTDEQEQRPPDRKKTENKKKDQERKQNYYSMDRQNMLLAQWSTNELKRSSIAVPCLVARTDAAGIDNNEHFAMAELSHGLQPGGESMRSLLA